MNINQNNYEAWFLDYYEKQLSAEQVAELFLFLEQHPLLKEEFDAVVLSGGSTMPRDLPIPGRELKGVHFAMDFLTQQNRRVGGKKVNTEEIWATGKNVVVIGGGDTGSDCVGTSNRHGAKSVTQIEILSKPPKDRTEAMPWPSWPMILRTSTSHEEGCERQWSIVTKEFIGDEQGNVKAV